MKISGGDDDESVGVCNGEESGDSVIVSGGAVAISSAIRGQMNLLECNMCEVQSLVRRCQGIQLPSLLPTGR